MSSSPTSQQTSNLTVYVYASLRTAPYYHHYTMIIIRTIAFVQGISAVKKVINNGWAMAAQELEEPLHTLN